MSMTEYFAGSWRILCGLSQTDLKYILYLIWCPWLTILQDPEEFYVAFHKLTWNIFIFNLMSLTDYFAGSWRILCGLWQTAQLCWPARKLAQDWSRTVGQRGRSTLSAVSGLSQYSVTQYFIAQWQGSGDKTFVDVDHVMQCHSLFSGRLSMFLSHSILNEWLASYSMGLNIIYIHAAENSH